MEEWRKLLFDSAGFIETLPGCELKLSTPPLRHSLGGDPLTGLSFTASRPLIVLLCLKKAGC